MLRKLILFAITSGLAKKAWDQYRQQRAADADTASGMGASPRTPPVDVRTPPVGTQATSPASPVQYH